jgi:Mitochondrial carrier protein
MDAASTFMMWPLPSWFALFLAVGVAAASATSRRPLSVPFSFRGGGGKNVVGVVQQQQHGPLQVFTQTIKDARRHLTAAAVARSTSIFTMYPIDVLKTRLQMQQVDAFRLDGLFNGVGGSLVGQVPYGVLTFGSYEMYKAYLLDRFPNVKPIFKYAAAAVMGDLTGSGWLCEFVVAT